MAPSPASNSSRAAWLPFWSVALLLAINLLNYIDRFVLAAVVPEIERDFKTSSALTGTLSTAFLLSYMVAAPIFGWLADRYSRWLLVAAGVLIWSIASGASGLAPTIGIMLLTRVFVGIGEGAYGPAAPTIISDLYPVERRGRVMACFYVAIPVGSALGYLLGGLVLKMGFSWHWAFFVVVPPGIIAAILAQRMRDPSRPGSKSTDRKSAPAAGWREYSALLRTPSYVFNTLGMTAMTFAMGGIAFWMPKYIVWRQKLEGLVPSGETAQALAAQTDALGAANAKFGPVVVASGLLGTMLGGLTGDYFRPRLRGSYFLVSSIAMALAFPLVWGITAAPFAYIWYLTFAACFCLFFNTGPTNTILANVTRPQLRAAGFAINIFLIHALGDAISPPLIGAINDAAGDDMNRGFLVVSFAILVSAILWLCGSRFLDRDTLQAEAAPHPSV